MHTKLCDSNGEKLCVGDLLRIDSENTTIHGQHIFYRIHLVGLIPILILSRFVNFRLR